VTVPSMAQYDAEAHLSEGDVHLGGGDTESI